MQEQRVEDQLGPDVRFEELAGDVEPAEERAERRAARPEPPGGPAQVVEQGGVANLAIVGSLSAAAKASSLEISDDTVRAPRNLPFTCTAS